jgi:hypothetical protein
MKTISAIESEPIDAKPGDLQIITEDYVGRTYNYTNPKTNRLLSVKITEDMVGKPLEEVLDEADAKAVESENKSKVNWRRFWKGAGKLALEVFLVMWFIIFFNLGKKFDCAVLGFLSTYISLVPIHVFLWEGITQKLNKKAASKE